MEELKEVYWECDMCGKANSMNVEKCDDCQNGKPEIKKQKELVLEKISPLCILEIFKGKVIYNEDCGHHLTKIFDHKKPLVVIIAAGQVGTGKSTWLNSLVYELTTNDESHPKFTDFIVGHTQQSQTEGLWIYPFAFKHKEIKNVQFMLCDMEGMGGIKPENAKIVEESLKRLYTFVIHIFVTNFILI